MTLAYTIGRTSSYDRDLLLGPSVKLGRETGYIGGIVFPTIGSAKWYLDNKLQVYQPTWDPKNFSVYEMCLPHGWKKDVSPDFEEDEAHHLLVDAQILRKIEIP